MDQIEEMYLAPWGHRASTRVHDDAVDPLPGASLTPFPRFSHPIEAVKIEWVPRRSAWLREWRVADPDSCLCIAVLHQKLGCLVLVECNLESGVYSRSPLPKNSHQLRGSS